MPRPTPNYLPTLVVDLARDKGLTPNHFAERLGFEPGRFYTYFQGSHAHFRRYAQLADACGLTLETLVRMAENGQLREVVESKAKTKGLSLKRFAAVHGLSSSWLYDILPLKELNALNGDKEMAAALQVDLDTMRELVGV